MDVKWNVEWVTLIVTALTALGAAGWAIQKWSAERTKDRKDEEKRLAALYVNPFLFACDDLQSRLYNILCKGGLQALRESADRQSPDHESSDHESPDHESSDHESPDYRYAEETLFLVAEYFAYERFLLRYTQYGTDSRLMHLIQKIRDEFATDAGYVDSWCIFRPQQNALGRLVFASRQSEQGADVDTISLLDFEKKLIDEGAAKSLYLEQALAELNNAEYAASIPPRTQLRLAKIQYCLCELIEHLEVDRARRKSKSRTAKPDSFLDRKRNRAYDPNCEACQQAEDYCLQVNEEPEEAEKVLAKEPAHGTLTWHNCHSI